MSTVDQFIPSKATETSPQALLRTRVNTRHLVIDLDVNHTLAPAALAALASLATMMGTSQACRATCFPPPWTKHRAASIRTPQGALHTSIWATHQTLSCCQPCACWGHGSGLSSISRAPLSLLKTMGSSTWLCWKSISEYRGAQMKAVLATGPEFQSSPSAQHKPVLFLYRILGQA